jgi:hypothetical protein
VDQPDTILELRFVLSELNPPFRQTSGITQEAADAERRRIALLVAEVGEPALSAPDLLRHLAGVLPYSPAMACFMFHVISSD